MSFKAACPELDDLIQIYYDLSDPTHSLQLDQVEAKLELCLAQERLDRDDPYPNKIQATLQVSDISVFEGGAPMDPEENYLDQFDGFNQRLDPHYVSDSLPVDPQKVELDLDQFEEDLDTVHPMYLTKVNPNMYYVYVKTDPCPYLANTRNMLLHIPHEERPFTNDDVGQHALGPHAAILQSEAEKGTLSSPQIFHGDQFIPGGSEGLAKYLGIGATKKKTPPIIPFVPPTFTPRPHSSQQSTDWFVYGSYKCGYCRQAMDILGDHATFVELYTYKPTLQTKPFPHIHPMHAKLVGAARAAEIRDEIVKLRDSEGVPIMYHIDQRVPNDFKKLRQLV